MKCSECGKDVKTTVSSYEYTEDAGLDGQEYTVLLQKVDVVTCECGVSAVIPGMERLHALIAVAIAVNPRPVQPSGLRFLRRFLGMTQVAFAELVRTASESISYWETGTRSMSPEMDVNIRIRVLAALARNERVQRTKILNRPDVMGLIDRLFERVDLGDKSPVEITPMLSKAAPGHRNFVDGGIAEDNGMPAAWAIPELEKMGNGNHGAVN